MVSRQERKADTSQIYTKIILQINPEEKINQETEKQQVKRKMIPNFIC